MAEYETYFTPMPPGTSFSDFFIREETEAKIAKGTIECLADLLEHWIADGDATDVCPTFEYYLLAAIDIIAAWNRERSIAGQWDCPVRAGTQPHHTVLPGIICESGSGTVSDHPAFQREFFDLVQHQRARRATQQ